MISFFSECRVVEEKTHYKIQTIMKLNKLFLLMLALPLAFGGCKKSEAPKSGSEYLFDVQMSAAERVMEVEGTTFEDNQFMLVFTDASESCMLTIFIQGEAGEKALHAGEYKRALDIESTSLLLRIRLFIPSLMAL